MFENNTEMSDTWRDRSGVLRALGFFLLLAASGTLFAAPILFLRKNGSIMEAIGLFFQCFPLGVTLLICGFGLSRLRRWSLPAVIVVSFVFLAKGVLFTLQFINQLPLLIEQFALSQKALSPDLIEGLQRFSILLAAFVYLFLPAVYLWVVSGRNAARTVASKDSTSPWMEHIPGPVLALAFLFAWEGAGLLTMLWFNAAVPVFGRVVYGGSGFCVLTGAALCCFACARGLAKKALSAWRFAVGLLILASTSWAITYQKSSDPALYRELYARMGFLADNLQLLLLTEAGPWNARWTLAGTVATLAYALWLKRFFVCSDQWSEGEENS